MPAAEAAAEADRARRSEKAVTGCRAWHVALGGAGVCSGAQNDDSRGLPREDNHWMHISEWCFALGGTGVCNRARRGGSRGMPRKRRWPQRCTKAKAGALGQHNYTIRRVGNTTTCQLLQ